MLTREEKAVLSYLQERIVAAVADLAQALPSEGPPGWLGRAIWNLGWLGYLDVCAGPSGEPRTLQITQKGLAEGGAWPLSHADLPFCSPPSHLLPDAPEQQPAVTPVRAAANPAA